jgi:hypothetical protein
MVDCHGNTPFCVALVGWDFVFELATFQNGANKKAARLAPIIG